MPHHFYTMHVDGASPVNISVGEEMRRDRRERERERETDRATDNQQNKERERLIAGETWSQPASKPASHPKPSKLMDPDSCQKTHKNTKQL